MIVMQKLILEILLLEMGVSLSLLILGFCYSFRDFLLELLRFDG